MEEEKTEIHFGGAVNYAEKMKDPNLPKYYANGFVIGRAEHDIFIMPLLNSNPELVLNLSFNAAKKLQEILKKNLDEIEAQIGEVKSMPPVRRKP